MNVFCEDFEFPVLDSGVLGVNFSTVSVVCIRFLQFVTHTLWTRLASDSSRFDWGESLAPVKLLLQLGARHRSNNSASNQATARTIMNNCTSVLHT